jgi:hypothetical protein
MKHLASILFLALLAACSASFNGVATATSPEDAPCGTWPVDCGDGTCCPEHFDCCAAGCCSALGAPDFMGAKAKRKSLVKP